MDYDSARHHLEAVQNAKKKDEAKTAKVKKKKKKPSKTCPLFPHNGEATVGLGNDKFNAHYPQRNPVSSNTNALRLARDLMLGRAWSWGRRGVVPSKPIKDAAPSLGFRIEGIVLSLLPPRQRKSSTKPRLCLKI